MLVENLTEIDYRILEFISHNEPIKIDDIKNKLPNISSLEYRINLLATPEHRKVGYDYVPIDNTYCLKEECEYGNGVITTVKGLQIYSLTDMGRKALQDYKTEKKRKKRELWIKNAWPPILVSVATNLLIIGIKWLLPLIQKWLSNFF